MIASNHRDKKHHVWYYFTSRYKLWYIKLRIYALCLPSMPVKTRPPKPYKCFCTSLKCNGASVNTSVLESHKRLDEAARRKKERTQRTTMDTMVQQVFRMTLESRTSTPESKCGDAFWERTSDKTTQRLFHTSFVDNSATSLLQSGIQAPSPPIPQATSATQEAIPTPASIPPKSTGRKPDGRIPKLYATLVEMDHNIAQHTRNVANIVNSTVPALSDEGLRREEQWFSDIVDSMQVVNTGGDDACIVLLAAMVDKVSSQLSIIEMEIERRAGAQLGPVHQGIVFNTGMSSH